MGESAWKVEVLLTGSWRGATSALLSNGRQRLVVDTGLPHEAHQLLNALKKRGCAPADIQIVMNTHYHVDHVLNNCLFPGSLIYGPQQSYEWCKAAYSELRESDWKKRMLKYYPETYDYNDADANMERLRKFTLRWWDVKRVGALAQFRWTETHALPEGLEGLVTHGHVPGHLSLIVPECDQRTVVAGDAFLTRDHDEQVLTMIPYNRKQALLDRDLIMSSGGRIIPGHDREFTLSETRALETPARQ